MYSKNRVRMSRKFRKTFHRLDGELADRVLAAILEIAGEPCKPRGNTIKPLQGILQGMWRYRLEDYRLIYQLDMTNDEIILIAFENRGDAYV